MVQQQVHHRLLHLGDRRQFRHRLCRRVVRRVHSVAFRIPHAAYLAVVVELVYGIPIPVVHHLGRVPGIRESQAVSRLFVLTRARFLLHADHSLRLHAAAPGVQYPIRIRILHARQIPVAVIRVAALFPVHVCDCRQVPVGIVRVAYVQTVGYRERVQSIRRRVISELDPLAIGFRLPRKLLLYLLHPQITQIGVQIRYHDLVSVGVPHSRQSAIQQRILLRRRKDHLIPFLILQGGGKCAAGTGDRDLGLVIQFVFPFRAALVQIVSVCPLSIRQAQVLRLRTIHRV